MKKSSFKTRLERVKKQGSLTTADLSILLGRPYHTVRGWLQGYEPWGPHGEESRRLLSKVESTIKKRRGLPVPVRLSPIERRDHVTQVRHDIDGRLSQARPTP
jgi:hypothetical protein